MCNTTVLDFVARAIRDEDLAGKAVLEVGSLDVNGSPRPLAAAAGVASYLGVDLFPGPGVDRVLSASALVDRLGPESFDVVFSTEMLEHVQDWRWTILNLKRVLRPGGLLILTTRSPGFAYHGYPHDFWRFTAEDFRKIFGDMEIELLEPDAPEPGICIKARKPADYVELDLDGIDVATVDAPAWFEQALQSITDKARASVPASVKTVLRRVR